jgi:hypothetical protein
MSGARLKAAQDAAVAALEALRDGVRFAVISGTSRAHVVYPGDSAMAVADHAHLAKARLAIRKLRAGGGTSMGTWLQETTKLFAAHEIGVRQAILLTDGKNGQTAKTLDKVLAECEGKFVCDCRGVGTDWKVAELRKVASALLGSIDIVAKPEDLVADFRAMVGKAMAKTVGDVALRIWTPQNSGLRYVKQVLPSVEDLTGRRSDGGPLAGDYPLGAWGSEARDYHLCVDVPPGRVGTEVRAAWVKLMVGEEVVASGNVLAEWTDNEMEVTRINPSVAHYTGQAELAETIQAGLQAREAGDLESATARLGRAVQLAQESGNQAMSDLLGRVVDIDDPATGTIRLKPHVDKADEMSLDTRSTRTVRTRRDEG